MFCIECAEKLHDGGKFCHRCGTAVPATPVLVASGSTLSKDGEQSLLSLKAKFETFKEKSIQKRNIVHRGRQAESESHILGVQILDKNFKPVKRIFKGPNGFTGIIHITVDGSSTGTVWKELVQAKFNHCKLTLCRFGEGVFERCVSEDGYKISDLREEKRRKHLKELRCYMLVEGKDRNQIQKCFLGNKSNSSTKEFFTSSSSDFEVEPELTKKEEKNVQPSALCESSAVSSTSTVICTSDCASSQNADASLELPATKSAVPSTALVDDSLCTEQKEESSLQSTAISDTESSTKVAASFFASISGSTSDVESSSMEDELPHMTICHRKRQTPLRHVVDRKKMRYDAAKEYLPEMGETDQTRSFVIINGSTNEAMEGQLNVAESIKGLYSWIAGTVRLENLPAQFGLVCMSTFHDMECTDLGCEHAYPLETDAGRTSSVALLPEVLVIKKIGDVLDGTLTAFDEVYFSV